LHKNQRPFLLASLIYSLLIILIFEMAPLSLQASPLSDLDQTKVKAKAKKKIICQSENDRYLITIASDTLEIYENADRADPSHENRSLVPNDENGLAGWKQVVAFGLDRANFSEVLIKKIALDPLQLTLYLDFNNLQIPSENYILETHLEWGHQFLSTLKCSDADLNSVHREN
jgi:hypothetical protein